MGLATSSRFLVTDFQQVIQGAFIRFKLFAHGNGTDLDSFAKMIELPPQPARP
jgi:hypothetical protein